MTPERSQRNNDAGTNPNVIPQHLENVPFDNTSIQEAVDNNIIDTTPNTDQLNILQSGDYRSPRPPAKEAPLNSSEYQVPVETKKGRGRLYTILGGAAATAVAVTALFLLPKGENNSNENKLTPTQPVATAEATPTQTAAPETQLTKEQLIASFELSVEEYPDAASLSNGIIDRWTAWENQGATQKNRDTYMDPDSNLDLNDFAEDIAAETAPIFPSAIFVDDYETNPRLTKFASDKENTVRFVTFNTLITWDDDVRYERTTSLVGKPKLISGSAAEKQMTFSFDWKNSSNADRNKIGSPKYYPEDKEPWVGTYTFTAIDVNGKWKISDLQWQ